MLRVKSESNLNLKNVFDYFLILFILKTIKLNLNPTNSFDRIYVKNNRVICFLSAFAILLSNDYVFVKLFNLSGKNKMLYYSFIGSREKNIQNVFLFPFLNLL